jgi:hypothetical protein
VRLPDVPVKVTVAVVAAEFAAAVRVKLCGVPGVRVSEAGRAVTPAGSPVMVILTDPLKEFNSVAVTLTGDPAAPAVTVSMGGETASEKSGVGGGVVTGA